MTDQTWDDDQLFAILKEALRDAESVPREFIEAGKAAYAWRNIDLELAALTYDSAVDCEVSIAGTRAEPAALRSLTFTCHEMTIELEVTDDALVGQIAPGRAGERVAVRVGSRDSAYSMTDEVGFFVVRPVPDEPFRLLVRTTAGRAVLTGWISP
jgi:hypothetical protein